jgi:peptidoglycan/xylan/chitin deacetylase (PgdA/CDA1 family)
MKVLRQSVSGRILIVEALLGALICLLAPESSQGTYLVFTTDVCWTCGDDFQGTWEGKDYGVPLIAEKLEQYGLKGTFFVSSLCPKDLTDKMFSNLRFLVSRGHDLQMHPHPNAIDVSRPLPTMYSIDERRKFLELAIANIEKAGAPRPIAHRAAAWAIDKETLGLLTKLGIPMDSSIFPIDPRSLVPLPEDLINRFAKIDGVYQLPITLIRRIPFIGYMGMTALDIDRTIWEEQEEALKQIADHGLPVATVYMHFYNFFRYTPPTVPYEPLRIAGPRTENIRKLDNMLKLVTSDKRFKVVTARELWHIFQKSPQELQGPAFVPYTGMRLTYVKAWEDFFGHGIKNKIVVLLPILLILALVGGVARSLRKRNSAQRG